MQAEDVARYLARIDYAGPRAPTVAALRELHRAHLAAVPFENLDIHLGREIRLDRAALLRKIVDERRGGFCYELNGLFAALLRSLGFDVALVSARVARDAGGFGPEHDHMALLVTCEGRWLADVGFGKSFHAPLSLDEPDEDEAEGLFFRVAHEAGAGWLVTSRAADGPAAPEYAFTLAAQPLEAFGGMCAWHQTSPESHFTKQILCSRPTPRGRVTVTGRTLVVAEDGARTETPLADDAAIRAALEAHFDVRLPSTALAVPVAVGR